MPPRERRIVGLLVVADLAIERTTEHNRVALWWKNYEGFARVCCDTTMEGF